MGFTRSQIIQSALDLIGVRFLHQGRDPATGLDCVGLLVEVGKRVAYPHVDDVAAYRRVPSAEVIRQMLHATTDEIAMSEIKDGDVYLMRMGGVKPRHVDFAATYNARASVLHASASGVRVEDKTNFPASWFVAAFRLRGVLD